MLYVHYISVNLGEKRSQRWGPGHSTPTALLMKEKQVSKGCRELCWKYRGGKQLGERVAKYLTSWQGAESSHMLADATVEQKPWKAIIRSDYGLNAKGPNIATTKYLTKIQKRGVPVVAQWKQIWPVSLKMQVRSLVSLSGLRIWLWAVV